MMLVTNLRVGILITIIITTIMIPTTTAQDCYLGEILMGGFNFAPKGYALCNGQILSLSQNTALFSILGTTYGGNGQTTFALPNLQDKIPIHYGQGPGLSNYVLGQTGGTERVTLTSSQMPSHSHHSNGYANYNTCDRSIFGSVNCTTGLAPCLVSDNGGCSDTRYIPPSIVASGSVGGNADHNNNMPTLSVNYFICIAGIFPSRNKRSDVNKIEEENNEVLEEDNNEDSELKYHQKRGSEPFLGEIMIFAGNFPVYGWANLNGQLMSLSQNTALFSLLGTYYGGDGTSNFGIPDLRGRVGIHATTNYPLGAQGGLESVTLTTNQLPSHSLQFNPTVISNDNPQLCKRYKAFRASTQCASLIIPDSTTIPATGDISGGSQPHPNIQPYLVLNFQIALNGIFPTRSKRDDDNDVDEDMDFHQHNVRELEPFLGEIRMVGFNFAPQGWALCNGQLLSIAQNQALFSLLGTYFGGDGTNTFALPNLQGRVAANMGTYTLGSSRGEEQHTLTLNEIPSHTATITTTTAKITGSRTPSTGCPSTPVRVVETMSSCLQGDVNFITESSPATAGSSQPHTNMQPYTVLTYVIALSGIFPSRN